MEGVIEAVKKGTLTDVKEALGKWSDTLEMEQILKAPGSMYTAKKDSLLHLACMYNIKNPEVAFYLIDAFGMHMNLTGSSGATPLMYACRSGLLPVIERFFEKETSFISYDSYSLGLLQYCFMGGYPSWTRKELLELGYDSLEEEDVVELLFNKIPKERHPRDLLLADIYDIQKQLSGYSRLDINKHKTVLDLVLKNEYKKSFPIMISNGIKLLFDYIDPRTGDSINYQTSCCRTFVHWCVETRQNDDYFQELLDKVGGNIINEINADGLTPLLLLVSNSWFWPFMRNNKITEDVEEDQLRITRFLLRNGASVNGYKDQINRTGESCSNNNN